MLNKTLLSTLFLPMVLVTEMAQAEENTNSVSDKTLTLDTLIVTAGLLDQSVQESAESAEIFDEDDIQNQAGITTLKDILETASNVSVMDGTGTVPTVRGIDGTGAAQNAIALFAGGRSRLSYEVDNRPMSFNEVAYSDLNLFDVNKVEVLRGPQSTLVGRNAMAGTVNIKTNDPVFENETLLRAATGNHNHQQISAVVNRPITEDSVAFRLAADWSKKESSVHYEPYDGVDDPGLYESINLRGKLLVEPDTENNARLLIGLSHSDYSGPANEVVSEPYKKKVSNAVKQPQHNPVTNTVSVDYSQDLSADFQFKLNASVTDVDFTRTTVENSTNTTIDTREYVLEPQVYFDDGKWNAVAGLYYYRAREEQFSELFSAGDLHYQDDTDTLSAYAESSLALSEDLALSLGLRHEYESRNRHGGDYSGGVTADDFNHDESYSELLPKVGINWHQSDQLSWGAQISKGYNAGGAGWTLNSATFAVNDYEYEEETSWTYEVYGRQTFLNGRVSSTQNLFHTRYKDLQLAYSTTGDWGNDGAYSIVNADKVNTWGLEQGLTVLISDQLTLSGSVALLKTEIVTFSDDTSLEGNDLVTSPTVTSSLNLDWHKEAWQASLNVRYSDRYFTYLANQPESKTDAYIVTNAKASYTLGNAELFASIENLFDEDAVIFQRSDAGSSSADTAVLLQPRTFLVGIQYQL
ncbi:TonB-dependent receptor [Marinomonas rhizomae]|uniref:Outer membrane receptor protein involved in Fe transport n=1 Tax=Marinomonas rhizomae TaxID=491948 RepID=A0A366IZJ3_9GAMM|nr:TonB-dependent receptor [Marinomonas rhizomae]RBP79414.1 outer membrane receptor protein involved in Fe transport [Marinomonas rhizomae]RNF71343.1 TonB-dependent receptor [Marinomonas rhizomae]